MFNRLVVRAGWYVFRKSEGYPITVWRALFGRAPRFGAYEPGEHGCPDWLLREYEMVDFYRHQQP